MTKKSNKIKSLFFEKTNQMVDLWQDGFLFKWEKEQTICISKELINYYQLKYMMRSLRYMSQMLLNVVHNLIWMKDFKTYHSSSQILMY